MSRKPIERTRGVDKLDQLLGIPDLTKFINESVEQPKPLKPLPPKPVKAPKPKKKKPRKQPSQNHRIVMRGRAAVARMEKLVRARVLSNFLDKETVAPKGIVKIPGPALLTEQEWETIVRRRANGSTWAELYLVMARFIRRWNNAHPDEKPLRWYASQEKFVAAYHLYMKKRQDGSH